MELLIDSTAIREDRDALVARLADDGYVFLRDTVPLDVVEAASQELLACLVELGVARQGESFVWTGISEDAVPAEKLHELVHDRVPLAEMWHAPEMSALMARVLGEPAHVYPYSDVRTYLPGQDHYLSPAHQDGHYFGPNKDFFTAWVPLRQIPFEVGGLAVARGSHKGGLRQHRKREDRRSHLPGHAQRFGIDEELIPEPWLTIEYRLGDVLIFAPYTAHKAPSNRSADAVRVSTDTRFQPASTARSKMATMTADMVRAEGLAAAEKKSARD